MNTQQEGTLELNTKLLLLLHDTREKIITLESSRQNPNNTYQLLPHKLDVDKTEGLTGVLLTRTTDPDNTGKQLFIEREIYTKIRGPKKPFASIRTQVQDYEDYVKNTWTLSELTAAQEIAHFLSDYNLYPPRKKARQTQGI